VQHVSFQDLDYFIFSNDELLTGRFLISAIGVQFNPSMSRNQFRRLTEAGQAGAPQEPPTCPEMCLPTFIA
jgi:hypothetical protein